MLSWRCSASPTRGWCFACRRSGRCSASPTRGWYLVPSAKCAVLPAWRPRCLARGALLDTRLAFRRRYCYWNFFVRSCFSASYLFRPPGRGFTPGIELCSERLLVYWLSIKVFDPSTFTDLLLFCAALRLCSRAVCLRSHAVPQQPLRRRLPRASSSEALVGVVTHDRECLCVGSFAPAQVGVCIVDCLS